MAIKKQIALGITIYGFLGYLVVAMIKPSLPFPLWAVGLWFALATGVCIWALVEKDWKLGALMGLGAIGYLGVCLLIGLVLI